MIKITYNFDWRFYGLSISMDNVNYVPNIDDKLFLSREQRKELNTFIISSRLLKSYFGKYIKSYDSLVYINEPDYQKLSLTQIRKKIKTEEWFIQLPTIYVEDKIVQINKESTDVILTLSFYEQ